ncbi:MAG: hypothetical protein HY659_12550 [Rhizobiales bacterium]|nr:hypothetical protein [Hyphomicrobiales bacterium]
MRSQLIAATGITVLVTGLAFANPTNSFVLAQAGSIGGTIGKQGKSVSGGDESSPPTQAAPTPAPPASGSQRSASREPARSGCRSIAGTWNWSGGLFGRNDTVFSSDGTAKHRSGFTGTWNCQGGGIYLHWKNWWQGSLQLSPDGRRLTDIRTGKVAFTR